MKFEYTYDIIYKIISLEYSGTEESSSNDNSVMYVKEYIEAEEYVRVGVKVASSGKYFVRTLHLLSTYNAERYIEKGTLKKVDN